MKKLLIATTNPGKLLEYNVLFKDLPVKLVTLKDLNITDVAEEDGKTFEENAVKKVEFYSKFVDFPVLAEDGGLEIDHLNGEPGVMSRRWPGHEATDQELVDLAIKKLEGVPMKKRGAQLKVAVAISIDGKVDLFDGVLRGVITEKPEASIIPGFPFRSMFYLPEMAKVLGDMTMEEEAEIAHRKQAIKKALPIIEKYYAGH
ncbi:MAG: non-canonical purine NTP pyrophosphatase [Candidatus Pacebacteria bacterium]|jgi:XTP/dITP diphosphohydrolase|nr:non-canonical purine NTP pyrophosphatase [Candidatus Paceibacterota bacterium]